jgi:hypothetical protein
MGMEENAKAGGYTFVVFPPLPSFFFIISSLQINLASLYVRIQMVADFLKYLGSECPLVLIHLTSIRKCFKL